MPSSDRTPPGEGNKRERGRRYEQLAAEYFQHLGFDILEQNWQASHKEIDLIVGKYDLIVFVEVKAAVSDDYGHPAEKVDRKKIKFLVEAAQRYLVEKKITGCDLRFDVVTFYKGRLEHFPDAFGVE